MSFGSNSLNLYGVGVLTILGGSKKNLTLQTTRFVVFPITLPVAVWFGVYRSSKRLGYEITPEGFRTC